MAYHRKKIIWLLILYVVIFGLLFSRLVLRPKILTPPESRDFKESKQELRKGTLRIGNQAINIELAENERQWYRGLSGRENLCTDCGMYFIFPDQDRLEFVMRDMKFPLDIIFIADNKILNIAENLAPEGSDVKNIYSSSGRADRVLEVNSGYCNRYGIKAGDFVSEIY